MRKEDSELILPSVKRPPVMPGDDSALLEVKRKIQKEAMRQAYYEHLVRLAVFCTHLLS